MSDSQSGRSLAAREDAALEKFRQTVVGLFTLGMDGDLLREEIETLWVQFLGPDEEDEDG